MGPASYLIICLASLSLWAASGAMLPAPLPMKDCPVACPQYILPLCGSDGLTYGNECFMRVAACRGRKEIRKAGAGPCPKPAPSTTAGPAKRSCKKHQQVSANANSNANSNANLN